MSEPITLNGEAVYECMPDLGQYPVTWLFAAQGDGYKHAGVDVGTPIGVTLVAPAPGIIVPFTNSEVWWTWPPGTEARRVKSFGEAQCIDHGVGRFRYTLIAHCSRLLVAIGDRVISGQPIAISGMTGVAAGAHYHWQRGDTTAFPRNLTNNVDPLRFLATPKEKEQPMTPAERGLINIAWGDLGRALAVYRVLRREPTPSNIRALLPEEGIEAALQNGDQRDDLNAALQLRGRLTALATSDVADAAYRAVGGTP